MLGIFLDTETNGLNAFKHHMLEIAFKIVDLSSGDILAEYETTLYIDKESWVLSNPESLKVNGFTYDQVAKGKSPSTAALEITSLLQKHHCVRGKSVFICQNPSFDRMFFSKLIDPDVQEELKWPYYWLDLASMYWAESRKKGREDSTKLPWMTGFSKDKIASVYGLPPEKNPHRAMNGVNHLLLCYEKIIGFK